MAKPNLLPTVIKSFLTSILFVSPCYQAIAADITIKGGISVTNESMDFG